MVNPKKGGSYFTINSREKTLRQLMVKTRFFLTNTENFFRSFTIFFPCFS